MEALGIQRQPIITVIPAPSVPLPPHFMNPFSAAAARATLFLRSSPSPKFRVFCTSPPPQNSAITLTTTTITTTPQEEKEKVSSKKKKKNSSSSRTGRVSSSSSDANQQLKVDWLESLTYPFPTKPQPLLQQCDYVESSSSAEYSDESHSHWVIGIDPDVSGALALLKTDHSGSSAQVFDSPHLKVLVGKRIRRRLDTKSIVELLQSFGAPIGTTAYLEQSLPYPQDGKQGWWSGGFGYGLWIGVLVASGYSVIPVPSLLWKNEFKLSGNGSSKDDSRELASALFPSMCSLLKRKKDHGRAEALLIAAYGKGLKISCDDSSCTSEDSVLPHKLLGS